MWAEQRQQDVATMEQQLRIENRQEFKEAVLNGSVLISYDII